MSPHRTLPSSGMGSTQAHSNVVTPASTGERLHAFVLTVGLVVITLGIGWLIWSLVEWGRSSTPGCRLTDLRLARRSDGKPAGLGRVLLREACCLVLIVPTVFVCCVLAIVFVMGASPPDNLLRAPRRAPWDLLSGTEVVRNVRPQPRYSQLRLTSFEPARRN